LEFEAKPAVSEGQKSLGVQRSLIYLLPALRRARRESPDEYGENSLAVKIATIPEAIVK
jgi:hypothetical protein